MKKFRIKKYQIYTNKIRNPEGIRFVLLADLHGFSYGRDNAGLIEAIRREKPDAVLSAGDMAVRTCPDTLVTACKLLKDLHSIFRYIMPWEIMNIKCLFQKKTENNTGYMKKR